MCKPALGQSQGTLVVPAGQRLKPTTHLVKAEVVLSDRHRQPQFDSLREVGSSANTYSDVWNLHGLTSELPIESSMVACTRCADDVQAVVYLVNLGLEFWRQSEPGLLRAWARSKLTSTPPGFQPSQRTHCRVRGGVACGVVYGGRSASVIAVLLGVCSDSTRTCADFCRDLRRFASAAAGVGDGKPLYPLEDAALHCYFSSKVRERYLIHAGPTCFLPTGDNARSVAICRTHCLVRVFFDTEHQQL